MKLKFTLLDAKDVDGDDKSNIFFFFFNIPAKATSRLICTGALSERKWTNDYNVKK